MDPMSIGLFAVVGVLGLIMLRVPIAVALIFVSFVGIWAIVGERPAMSMLSTVPYNFAASWTLSSVPMFLLMGYVAYHSGLTRGMFEGARAWLGWMPGGLAIASLAGAGGFAAVTGSSIACSAAIGRIAVPEMHRMGYDIRIATGSVAAGGTIGALIPPSILLILFGIQAEVSITKLFMGGLVVGLISLGLYIAAVLVSYVLAPERLPRAAASNWDERIAGVKEVWPVMVMIAIVFGGLFSGLFTATEAGAVGAVISILIGVARRTLSWKLFMESCVDTLLSSGSLFMIAIGANLFTRLVALSGLSRWIGTGIESLGLGVLGILILITLIYLALGMFLEPIGAMLLTLPLFLPLIKAHGVDVIWFGILLAKLLEIGMITPPVGLNVFVIHSVAKDLVKLEQIFAGILPFLLADLLLVVGMLATHAFF
ncbi:TRAP transporter large permease subunit [Thalassobius vesicularis]|uniref:TRAP transporter large permease protein n=1 Tax=Thalassobius vesicularis TaxID=1294297 RepID=A0A4S3M9U3_9RHOB|nr:TRAP transporter large permease subunit [Thalassobius vesicularis]THD72934.1 TRAP transporter large permease subunit [Thalassobius vesicularis]